MLFCWIKKTDKCLWAEIKDYIYNKTEASAWFLSPEISPIFETTKSKSKDAHASGVGFYSDMVVKVFGDTSGDVDEVRSPRFL